MEAEETAAIDTEELVPGLRMRPLCEMSAESLMFILALAREFDIVLVKSHKLQDEIRESEVKIIA